LTSRMHVLQYDPARFAGSFMYPIWSKTWNWAGAICVLPAGMPCPGRLVNSKKHAHFSKSVRNDESQKTKAG
jgi:hypothetical protein